MPPEIALATYHARFAPLFARAEQRAWAEVYLRGLLVADVPRKNTEAVALRLLGAGPGAEARVRALQEDGRNAFGEFQVPQAVLALKQGFGRLIRTKTDRGVLALLDSRIQRMAYGKIFLESLPGYATTQELRDVAKFLEA